MNNELKNTENNNSNLNTIIKLRGPEIPKRLNINMKGIVTKP